MKRTYAKQQIQGHKRRKPNLTSSRSRFRDERFYTCTFYMSPSLPKRSILAASATVAVKTSFTVILDGLYVLDRL